MTGRDYAGRLLSNQEFCTYLYHEAAPYEVALNDLISTFSTDFEPRGLEVAAPPEVDLEELSTPPYILAFFDLLIQLGGHRSVLEIGTFVGHSAMQFARMVGPTGHVTTIETSAVFADMAEANFRRNGLDDRITLLRGSASKVLDTLTGQQFDFVFVDGGKEDYLEYTIKSLDLLSEHGIIVVDDAFFHGDALNKDPSTEKGQGCKDLLTFFGTEKKHKKTIMPVGNGILVITQTR